MAFTTVFSGGARNLDRWTICRIDVGLHDRLPFARRYGNSSHRNDQTNRFLELPFLGRNDGAAMKFVILMALFSSSSIFAYPTPVDFNGKLSRWHEATPDQPITYLVEGDNVYDVTYFGSLVDEAADIWSNVDTSGLRLTPSDPNLTEQIRVVIVGDMSEAPYSAGYSSFDGFDSKSRPTHCTIKILSTLSYMSFAKTILHELGHCIGLGHSLIAEAIMSYELTATEFALDTDDIAAVSRLYPIDGSEPEVPLGCSVQTHPGRRSFPLWPLALPILMLPLMQKREKRSFPRPASS